MNTRHALARVRDAVDLESFAPSASSARCGKLSVEATRDSVKGKIFPSRKHSIDRSRDETSSSYLLLAQFSSELLSPQMAPLRLHQRSPMPFMLFALLVQASFQQHSSPQTSLRASSVSSGHARKAPSFVCPPRRRALPCQVAKAAASSKMVLARF